MTAHRIDFTTAEDARIAWVDYSKGICILMVLLLHAHFVIHDRFGSSGWIEPVVAFAKPFRMPDFFLIAGLFLSNVLDRPWRQYLDRKVVHFLYFYLLWTAIHFVLFGIKEALDNSGGDWSAVLPVYLMTFIQPTSSLWFVHSLALFFLVVRLCRTVPWWLMLGGAAALQMLNIQSGWLAIDEFCRRFVYFYSGYFFAKQVFQFAAWASANPRFPLLYLPVWALLNQWFVVRDWAALPGIGLVLGYVGAGAVILAAAGLSRLNWLRGLRYLGANSIVLYLTDYVVQWVALKLGLIKLPSDPGSLVLLLTIISVIGSLLLFWGAQRFSFGLLYQRPEWARLGTDKPSYMPA